MTLEEHIKSKYSYDSETGVVSIHLKTEVRPVGYVGRNGYLVMGFRFEGRTRLFYVHRVAWLLHYGEWPSRQIDHRYGIKTDNRVTQIRDVSGRENMCNLEMHRKGALTGVNPLGNRYRALVRVGGPLLYIGTFDTPQEAHQAYLDAVREAEAGLPITRYLTRPRKPKDPS